MRGRRLLLRLIPIAAVLLTVALSLSGRPDRVARAISCVPADGYETNQTNAETCPLVPGTDVSGLRTSVDFVPQVSFFTMNCNSPVYDEDWFSFSLQQGFDFSMTANVTSSSSSDLTFSTTAVQMSGQSGHFLIELYDSANTLLISQQNTAQTSKTITFTVPTTGTYKLKIAPLTSAGVESHCETFFNSFSQYGGDYFEWNYNLDTTYTPPTNPVVNADPYEENDFSVAPYDITLPFDEIDPTIYPAGDDDWFRFLGSPGNYQVEVSSCCGINVNVILRDPNNVQINSGTGTNPILTGALTQSGFYLLQIDTVNASETTLYTLNVSNTANSLTEDSYEQNDSLGAARLVTLPVNNASASIFPANDPDFYLFAANTGTVSASVQSLDSNTYTIRLYDPSNTQIATAGPSPNPTITNFAAASTGNYKLEVVPGVSGQMGNYRFNISNVAAAGQTEDSFEQNDTIGTARLVTTPQNNTAATLYPANDPDFYLFAANPGTINVSATATDGDQYTINLYSPTNALLASAGPSQNPSITSFNATASGNYKLEVVPATLLQTGAYTFSISTTASAGQSEDPYEQNDNAGSSYALTLPVNITNTTVFPVSDPDFFRFFSNAGTASINIYPNDSNMRFDMNLVNPDGTTNTSVTNSANPAINNATLTQTGNYRIEITEITGRSGGYSLVASYSQNTGPVAADPYEENDSNATPKQIGAVDNITTTTIFPASDPDYFQFFGTAGKLGLYLFAQNSSMNFTLRLYDPNGNLLQTSTGPNAAIVRDLTFQGYYLIEILETTGTTGKYLLNIGNGAYPTPTPMGTPATPLPTQTPSPTPDMGGNPDIAENNNSWGMAFRIAPGNEIGALNFNGGWGVDDIDYFVMNVKKDVQYTCETYNLGMGTDTIMSIYGPTADTNNLIGTHDDVDSKNGDVRSKITWKSAYQGQVYIIVDQVGPLTYPGAATYDFACDTGTSAGGSSGSTSGGGGGGGGASGGTTGGSTASGVNALSVEIIGAPERVAPPEPPPAGTLMVNVLIAYDENANGLIDLQEGVLGMSVRAIDVSTNKQLSSGFTDSHGNLQLLITAPQGNDVMIVIPFLSVGKTFDVNETSTENWRVLLPSSLLPGLIP